MFQEEDDPTPHAQVDADPSGLYLASSLVSLVKWEVDSTLAQHQMIGGVSFTLLDVSVIELNAHDGTLPF